MAPPTLLGPPELYQYLIQQSALGKSSTAGNPFVDLLLSNFNKLGKPAEQSPMGFTENMSATFLSSGNPCLDFFFHVVPDTPTDSLTRRLERAWNHDAVTTLKLICNLRGERGTGKSDQKGFYTAALWLHNCHPKTLAGNIPSLADFGYFKDLPEILYRLLEGSNVRQNQKKEWFERKGSSRKKRRSSIRRGAVCHNRSLSGRSGRLCGTCFCS